MRSEKINLMSSNSFLFLLLNEERFVMERIKICTSGVCYRFSRMQYRAPYIHFMEAIMNIEEKIGYEFTNKNLLETALTHTSYANEMKGRMNNERSEFLGDAVLELISSEYIFKTYPQLSEGEMTKTRAYCVCEDSLAEIANKYGFSDFLHVGKSEEKVNGVYRNSILADSVEAVIGAIFLDSGIEKAKEFILPNLIRKVEEYLKSGGKDYKTQLQEKLQIHGDVKIEYKIIGEEGPEHNKTFVSEVYCNGKLLGQGKGKSKKDAEMEAAKRAL